MTTQNQYFPKSSPHPGESLGEKLEEMQMGPKEFALRTAKPEKTIIAILKGKSSITPDMAVQFENVTKILAHFWMNHQRSYDEYIAREKNMASIELSASWAKKFPLKEMIDKSWLPQVSKTQEITIEMLKFFGFSNHDAWEDYYFNQKLKVNFRISLAHTKEPYAISAWLRKGELQAAEMEATAYSEKQFKEVLPKLKSIMAQQPDDFIEQIQSICLKVGVKVVFTPHLNKAPISGCTRWLNNTPLIQLSDRYMRNDIFWFSFFHGVGHILLHGKKDVFMEKLEYSDKDHDKEHQADEFAVKWLLSKEEEAEILCSAPLPLQADVLSYYAKKFKTHPAIIIGRLQ